MSTLSPEIYYRRNLPHIQPLGATFFITFRLAGSLPKSAVDALHEEMQRIQSEIQRLVNPAKRDKQSYQEQRRFFAKWDALLDAATEGPDWLRNSNIAKVVSKSLYFFDKQRYDLLAFCLMINHAHVVMTPLLKTKYQYYPLAQIIHSIKGYTAGKANQILARSGAFWQHKSYDHYVRDEGELARILAYVVNNPVKAGLVSDPHLWPWTYCKYEW